jgi:hypothetical protein
MLNNIKTKILKNSEEECKGITQTNDWWKMILKMAVEENW